MTGGRNGTRTSEETLLRHLQYSVLIKLGLMLDIDKQWEKLVTLSMYIDLIFIGVVTLIPRNLGDVGSVDLSTASNEKRYSQLQIRTFEEKGKRLERSPTKAIIDDWATQNTMVKHLIRVLQEANLGEAANYLYENVLNKGPIPNLPARINPSSSSLTGFPEQDWTSNGPTEKLPRQQKQTEAQKHSAKTDIYKLIGPHREMRYQVLQHITLDFKHGEVAKGGRSIRSGGFGEVFLGVFDNGHKVAIKKLKRLDETEEMMKPFKTELEALTKYRHPNIVCLYAYSINGPAQCLVYEYLPNGSLEDRLQLKNQTVPLSIKTRLAILQGTAKGIAFLNTQGIVHRDIKSANVLLDEEYMPKVGDFATARTGPMGNQTEPMFTSVVIGTSAYLAPEAIHFDVSTKLDSFSYGIVVLEVLTALPPMDDTREERDLKSHIDEYGQQEIKSLLDYKAGQWSEKLVAKLIDISTRCTAKKKQRVNVADILEKLDALDAFVDE